MCLVLLALVADKKAERDGEKAGKCDDGPEFQVVGCKERMLVAEAD